MGISYDVEINYLEKGDLGGAKLGGLTAKLSSAKSAFGDLASGIKESFGEALDMVGSIASSFGGLALAGAGGMVALGTAITKVSSHLEDTTTAFAAMFAAAGATKDFNSGLGLAQEQIAKMRKDAAQLPGEFQDLANIMQVIAPNAISNGMSVDDVRKFSARAMAVSAVKGISMPIAAREMGALMEGHATSQNLLWRRLGLGVDTRTFNQMSFKDRKKTLDSEFQKPAYGDAINTMQHQFTALFSTFKDNLKTVATAGGAPIFNAVKGGLEKINSWFNNNQTEIVMWAEYLSSQVVKAFEYGAKEIREWYPAIKDFAIHAWGTMKEIFEAIKPYVMKLGEMLKEAFTHPGETIDKLKSLLELYAAVKIGGPLIAPMLASGMSSGALGEGAGGAVMMLGRIATSLEFLIPAAALAIGKVAEEKTANGDSDLNNRAVVNILRSDSKSHMSSAGYDWESAKESISQGIGEFGSTLGIMSAAISNGFTQAVEAAANELAAWATLLNGNRLNLTNEKPEIDKDIELMTLHKMSEKDNGGGNIKPDKPPVPPNHSTHIQKVEIVVQTNQDPQRVAELARDELVKLMKNPKGSKGVPSFLGRKG